MFTCLRTLFDTLLMMWSDTVNTDHVSHDRVCVLLGTRLGCPFSIVVSQMEKCSPNLGNFTSLSPNKRLISVVPCLSPASYNKFGHTRC